MVRRERITEAALQLFAEKGYRAVRMDDLAEYLGISKKTLYNHFPGKHELFTKAMQGRVDDCLNLLDEIIDDRSRDFLTRLRDVLRTAGDVMSFTNLIREDRGLPGDLLDAVLGEVQDHVLSLIRKMVDEGLALGYIREDLQTESLPYIHLSIIESFIKMESRFGIKAGVKEMLTFIETIVFSGLLSEKGRRAFEEAK